MSDTRRFLVLLVLATTTFFLYSCGSMINHTTAANPCSNGHGSPNKQAPIVCVDDTGADLVVDPDPVTAHDRQNGTNKPVTVQWFTVSGADLVVKMNTVGCVSHINCQAPGKCTATTIPFAATQCKYEVSTPTKHLDPILIVTNCCS